uniref:Neuronal membrane glycoprotein M6-a n=1 Tax=Phallusia mammillata TaxID=59560 RepID=A0A6F9DDE1_9ASCI|nr:neuronal membrane glycoprotein M6-a [Phallusia mammillata]
MMGCFSGCVRCLSLVPWASLIATVMCWAGTAVFCGTGHEAITYTFNLLETANISGFNWTATSIDEVLLPVKYATYGIAAYMFGLTLLIFIFGLFATRAVKSDYEDSCITSGCGICIGVFATFVSYLTTVGWILIICGAALPLYVFTVIWSQCDAVESGLNACIDFVQLGIFPPSKESDPYGRLCNDQLEVLCNDQNLNLTYQLYIIAFVGAGVALLSMKQYLMCLSANYAYIKMVRKLAVYEDVKYREEMELNDIINTARSNERLTYKY